MSERKEYPKTLEAVRHYEGGAWGVVDALVTEIAVTASGNAKAGEFDRVQAFLTGEGFDIGRRWIQQLFRVGCWVSNHRLEAILRTYSPKSVEAARQKAKDNHEKAVTLLEQHGGVLHKITNSTHQQPLEARIASASPEEKVKLFSNLAADREVVEKAVKDQKVRTDLTSPIRNEYVDLEKKRQTKHELQEIEDFGEVVSSPWSRMNLGETMMKCVHQLEHVTAHVARHLDVETMDPEFKDELLGWNARVLDAHLALTQVLAGGSLTDDQIEAWLNEEVV